jgi:hypothetical protein
MASEDSLIKLYIAIGDAERHFNTIQSNYRLLASTWTLACLGGIGFVLTTQQINVGLERPLICIGIALSGALSILILWLLDIHVYQQLLSEFYNEGRVMETAMPWLPQVRLQTRRRFKGSLARAISAFYVLLFAFLCLVAVGFIFLSEETKKLSIGREGCAAIVIALCAVGAFGCCGMRVRARSRARPLPEGSIQTTNESRTSERHWPERPHADRSTHSKTLARMSEAISGLFPHLNPHGRGAFGHGFQRLGHSRGNTMRRERSGKIATSGANAPRECGRLSHCHPRRG